MTTCDDCLFCDQDPEDNCISCATHEMCPKCGHCLGNHGPGDTPQPTNSK